MSYFTHLECGMCAKELPPNRLWNLCPDCQKPLLARYDLDAARKGWPRESLTGRPPNLWRYGEMLPVRDARYRACLGEGFTPLIHAGRLGEVLNFLDARFVFSEQGRVIADGFHCFEPALHTQ